MDRDQACAATLTTNHKCRVRGCGVVYGRMPLSATPGCCLFALMHHRHLLPGALRQLPRPTRAQTFHPDTERIPNVPHVLRPREKRGCPLSRLRGRRCKRSDAEFFHWWRGYFIPIREHHSLKKKRKKRKALMHY